MDKKIKVYV